MPTQLPVSVCMVVRNEAHRIADTIARVRPHVEEVVVVDQQSDDGTWPLVQELADRSVQDHQYGSCERSRPLADLLASRPWRLVLDADERLSDYGWHQLGKVVRSDLDVVFVGISTWVGGRFVQSDCPMACPRVYRRGKVDFADELHGVLKPKWNVTVGTVCDITLRHEKTLEEQQADEDRYARLAGRPARVWTDESRFH